MKKLEITYSRQFDTYKVVKAHNMVTPVPGDELTKDDVEVFCKHNAVNTVISEDNKK